MRSFAARVWQREPVKLESFQSVMDESLTSESARLLQGYPLLRSNLLTFVLDGQARVRSSAESTYLALTSPDEP